MGQRSIIPAASSSFRQDRAGGFHPFSLESRPVTPIHAHGKKSSRPVIPYQQKTACPSFCKAGCKPVARCRRCIHSGRYRPPPDGNACPFFRPVFPFPAKTVTDAAITSSLPDPAVPAPYKTRQEVSCGTFRKYAGKPDARHRPDILSCVFVR